MSTRSVIFHDLPQARAAVAQADAIGAPVELRSPPNGAAIIGPGAFKAIADDLAQTHPGAASSMILDCGTNAGLALAALRHGCKDICVDVRAETHAKIAAMAQAQSARLHDPVEIVLDLAATADGGTSEDRNRIEAVLEQFLQEDAHDV